jgi:hypothetical protein
MISIPRATDRAAALRIGNFEMIGARGLGDGHNSYAYSAAWFRDHLYVGSNRDALTMLNYNAPFKFSISGDARTETDDAHFAEGKTNKARDVNSVASDMQIWPTLVPDNYEELDRQGQIWRYSPDSADWNRIYRAPLTMGTNGKEVPLAYGFRNMCVFQGRSDRQPALYTVPMCGRFTPGPVMLRSEDGEVFETLESSREALSGRGVGSFRGVVAFKGKLFVAPSGSHKGGASYVNMAPNASILCTEDPLSGVWADSSLPAFGDPTNQGVMDMAVCGGYLYVGTVNVERGFQLWKTDGEGPAPHRWVKVLEDGADRGPFNQVVLCFAEFNGSLYFGSAIQNGGFDRIHNVGPAAAEVLRIHPDDSWDLVVGQARMTRSGLKAPRSGLGPGFENPFCGYVWRMCAHDGALYVGTYDSSVFLSYSDRETWDSRAKRIIDEATLERYLQVRGGCELWSTTDGDNWAPITRNGFGSPFNVGVRALLSTPRGLVVGTANPFGPQVAIRGSHGWRYEDNPRGGFEVWLGTSQAGNSADESFDAARLPKERFNLQPALQDRGATSLGLPASVQAHSLTESVCPQGTVLSFRITPSDGLAAGESVTRDPQIRDCLLDLTSAESTGAILETVEEEISAYFGGSLLRCIGYWPSDVHAPSEAIRRQLLELLAVLPATPNDAEQRIGKMLLVVPAVRDPLEELAALLPSHASWSWLPPEALDAPRGLQDKFDAALCIEALHGPAGSDRLQAVANALRPGASLVAADFLMAVDAEDVRLATEMEAAHHELLAAAGLSETVIRHEMRRTWLRFHQHSRRFFLVKEMFHQIDTDRREEILRALPGGVSPISGYVVACARKPNE